jgi:hypothetical protein
VWRLKRGGCVSSGCASCAPPIRRSFHRGKERSDHQSLPMHGEWLSASAGGAFTLDFSRQPTRRPQCFDNMRADRFLLRELQFAQGAVADVVVRDISARVVQESSDAVLWYASRATLAGVGAPQGVVRGDPELRQVVTTCVPLVAREYPCLRVLRIKPTAHPPRGLRSAR